MNRALNIFLTGLWVMVLIISVYSIGPTLETRWFPVYSKFKIVTIESKDSGIVATFEYVKRRNCDPQGYAWYNGDLSTGFKQLNVRSTRTEAGQSRPLGQHVTTPMFIDGVTLTDMANQVVAELYSRCHPLWLTRSVVYP